MWKRILLLAALTVFASSCAPSLLALLRRPAIDIPARPVLGPCPPKPLIEGDIDKDMVIIPLHDAERLAAWISATLICYRTHEAVYVSHLEKLENRLKALQ